MENTTDPHRALSASDLLALGFCSVISEVIRVGTLNAPIDVAIWIRHVGKMKCPALLQIKAVWAQVMRPVCSLKLWPQSMNTDSLSRPEREIPVSQIIPITLILRRLQK